MSTKGELVNRKNSRSTARKVLLVALFIAIPFLLANGGCFLPI